MTSRQRRRVAIRFSHISEEASITAIGRPQFKLKRYAIGGLEMQSALNLRNAPSDASCDATPPNQANSPAKTPKVADDPIHLASFHHAVHFADPAMPLKPDPASITEGPEATLIRDALQSLCHEHRLIEDQITALTTARANQPESIGHIRSTPKLATIQHLIQTIHREQEIEIFPLLADHQRLDLDQLLLIWTRVEGTADLLRMRAFPGLQPASTGLKPGLDATNDPEDDAESQALQSALMAHAGNELQLIRAIIDRHCDDDGSPNPLLLQLQHKRGFMTPGPTTDHTA
ncbi:MAG: hypothetical protein PF961_00105 [Planctomycetota bacterium]|jgi:hypothetical protein|nr:hypothetical protein [Planctomycetota bacterium]